MLKRHSGIPAALLFAGSLLAQAPAAGPVFEVSSIKPAPPLDPAKVMAGQMHAGMKVDAGHVDIGYFALADLIRTAYRIKPYQLAQAESLPTQRWDILAKIPDGVSADKVPEMLQALLADRFKLAIHRSNAERSIYALIAGKGGPKLKEAEPEAPAAAAPDAPPPGPPGRGGLVLGSGDSQVRVTPSAGGRGATITSPKMGNVKISMGEAGAMRMEFSKLKMSDLADMLGPFTDRPVLDMTDLKGEYQVALDLPMQDLMNLARASGMGGMMGPAPDPARASLDAASTPSGSIFTAIQQLGLKLDSRKAPVETIFVDHVEKMPSEN